MLFHYHHILEKTSSSIRHVSEIHEGKKTHQCHLCKVRNKEEQKQVTCSILQDVNCGSVKTGTEMTTCQDVDTLY